MCLSFHLKSIFIVVLMIKMFVQFFPFISNHRQFQIYLFYRQLYIKKCHDVINLRKRSHFTFFLWILYFFFTTWRIWFFMLTAFHDLCECIDGKCHLIGLLKFLWLMGWRCVEAEFLAPVYWHFWILDFSKYGYFGTSIGERPEPQ
jgi:hypothetical protein